MNTSIGYINKLLTIAIGICVVAQIIVTNELASYGAVIHTSDTSIMDIVNENEMLTQQIAVAKSLSTLENKSKELGFVPAKSSIVLPQELPVALNNSFIQ